MNPVLLFIMASVLIGLVSEIYNHFTARYMIWAIAEVPGLLQLPKTTILAPASKPKTLNPRIKISESGLAYIPLDDLVRMRLKRLDKKDEEK